MPSHLSYERANNIYTAWMTAYESGEETTLKKVMRSAGIKSKDPRTLYHYRRMVEETFNCNLPPLNRHAPMIGPLRAERYESDKPYTAVIFSDAHWVSKHVTPAHSILLQILGELQPEIVIDNGDSWDNGPISRFAPNMWEHKPTMAEELEIVQYHRAGIEAACKPKRRIVNIGNHDMRFEAYLAKNAPEVKGMPGTKISDNFPNWTHTFSTVLNDTIVIKHRFRGGIHAAWNNVLNAGMSIATGHLHRLMVTPFDSYAERRYGIECGTLADVHGDQFYYTEDNPLRWMPGFVVLMLDGPRLTVELVEVLDDNRAFFRGKWYTG